jgi:hypothetical protein
MMGSWAQSSGARPVRSMHLDVRARHLKLSGFSTPRDEPKLPRLHFAGMGKKKNVLDLPLNPHKARVVDSAFARYGLASFVDLGGCWRVNGGYTFQALRRGDLARAVLVDDSVTELTRERAEEFPQLELIEGALGDPATVARVGQVDAALMFDILLHQVDPDWRDVLTRYAHIDTVIIHNPGWLGVETVRFTDFDVEEYIRRVFHSSPDSIRAWYDRHDEFNSRMRRPWRDVHNFWQWGITAKDLIGALWDLGYRIDSFDNRGQFSNRFPEIEVISLVARKRTLPHAP